MGEFRRLARYPLCVAGVHKAPAPRYPHGPVVADCPYCGKTCYFYGLAAYGVGTTPVLMPITVRPVAQLSS